MPYRRLPTTDKARLRALEQALKKVGEISIRNIPFSKYSIEELQNARNQFENTLKHYELNIKQQSDNGKRYKAAMETARMYLSHFIQVLLFASERGEINGGIKFYGNLLSLNGKLPTLGTEQEILEWGKIIVNGEQNRVRQGGSAIYSPSIALVKFKLEEFNDAAIFQQNLKRNTLRSFEKMQTLRKTTNDFIAQLWTEIENHIEMEAISTEQKRLMAEEFGIVYVLRRKERKQMAQQVQMEKEPEEKTEIPEKMEEKKLQKQFVQRDLFFEIN